MQKSRPTFEWDPWALSGLGLAAALSPCTASATLGEPGVSVQADVAQVKGLVKIMDRSIYRLHEIRLPCGTVTRAFAGAEGAVFAIAWNGPQSGESAPDLGAIL